MLLLLVGGGGLLKFWRWWGVGHVLLLAVGLRGAGLAWWWVLGAVDGLGVRVGGTGHCCEDVEGGKGAVAWNLDAVDGVGECFDREREDPVRDL